MNKIASVILFDVGCKKLSKSEDSFFAQSKNVLSRLILKKMLSGDVDSMGVILFGSERTGNSLSDKDPDNYQNIYVLSSLKSPGFQLYNDVQAISECKGYLSDWIQCIIVALDLLEKETKGGRFKTKQIVIFSEFSSRFDYKESMFTTIAKCLKDKKVKLTVVGPDIQTEGEDVPDNLVPLLKLLELVEDPLSISLDELDESTKYFEKKRKVKRVFNIDLQVGNSISIPVGWVKLTSESQRFTNWVFNKAGLDKKDENEEEAEPCVKTEGMELEDRGGGLDEEDLSGRIPVAEMYTTDDVVKITKFGTTEVTLSAADLSALKRTSGPASFKLLMFTPRSQVNPTMYVGEDVFAVMPKDGSSFSQAKLYSLIDAMISKKRVGIARRIVMTNGKVQIGVLIPFSDDCGKHLYFLKLPTAEWVQPFPRYKGYPKVEPEDKKLFKDLINSMKLPANLVEDGKGVLVPDPNFQLRCHILSERALNPDSDPNIIPEYIQKIVDPCPEYEEMARPILDKILKIFPGLNPQHRKQATTSRAIARAAQRMSTNHPRTSTNGDDTSIKKEPLGGSNDEITGTSQHSDLNNKSEYYTEMSTDDDVGNEDSSLFNKLIEQLNCDVNTNTNDLLDAVE